MKIAKEDNQVECLNCGNKQTLVIDNNIWQDIKGKFTVCETCDSSYNIEYEVIEMEESTRKEKFNYQMLSRLQSDCNYFLGNGNRNEKYLWDGSVEVHIDEMKKLYNYFDDNKKPEWLTWDNILSYENEMN